MVINLLPHYLGIAIPMALMLGTIITIDRLSRSSELSAAYGAGISLFHMTKPFLLIAFVMMILTVFIEGYLQPWGRYGYREVVNSVKQQSFSAILREGKFTSVGDFTFYAGTGEKGAAIGPVFIYEKLPENALRLTTAEQGKLITRKDSGLPVLQLHKGSGFRVSKDLAVSGQLEFGQSSVAGNFSPEGFRARGDDERELTTEELIQNRDGTVYPQVSKNVNNAALNVRIARAYLLLLIPFIAVPFGINYGRNPSSAGIFMGIVLLLAVQKALEFGQSLGAKGVIPPWAGIWPLMFLITIFAFFLYRNSAEKMGPPPLATVSAFLGDVLKDVKNGLKALFPATKKIETPS